MPTNIVKLALNTENISYDSARNVSYSTNDLGITTDTTHGTVSNFTSSTSTITIPRASVRPVLYGRDRSYIISVWAKVNNGNTATLHRSGGGTLNTNVVINFGASTSLAFFNTSVQTSATFDDNKWYHVALSRNVRTWILYVNGEVIITHSNANYNTGRSAQIIGGFSGNLLDYRVYTGENSSSDIETLYLDGPETIFPTHAEISSVTQMSTKVIVQVDNPGNIELVIEVDGEDHVVEGSEVVIDGLLPGTEYDIKLKT